MPSYLFRRGAVYCTPLVVPPRLRGIIGKSDLGCSLRTKDDKEAKRLLPFWLAEARAIIAAAEAELLRQGEAPADDGRPIIADAGRWQRLRDEYEAEHRAQDDAHRWAEDEAQEAAEALAGRIATNPDLLVPVERGAAYLVREVEQDRDRYRERYHRRKQRDKAPQRPVVGMEHPQSICRLAACRVSALPLHPLQSRPIR